MPLVVNLRHLEDQEIHLKGELPVEELALELHDELIRVTKPLAYDLELEKLNDSILVQGRLRLSLDCECARCLQPFEREVVLISFALHLPLTGDDKVSLAGDFLDLTPFVREDILLEFPQHPLCKPDCKGLKKKVGGHNSGDEKSARSAWNELDKLKL